MKEWFSARELAEAALPGLPQTLENASRHIKRAGSVSAMQVRARAGRGGGLEIHLAALPEAAQAELRRREAANALTPVLTQSEAAQVAEARERDQFAIAVQSAKFLTARQRRVMEARETILLALEAESIATGCSREDAICRLVQAARSGELNAAQARELAAANDKAGSPAVSRATLYSWMASKKKQGRIGLAPGLGRVNRRADELPPAWLDGFLAHYRLPTKPSIEQALRSFTRSLPDGSPAPSAKQVRLALKKLPQLERAKGREGKLALRARMAYTTRDFSDLLPTSVYSADGKTFDAEIAHPIHGQPFRPEITTIIDIATRRVVGWSAALDENTHGVVDALRQACAFGGIPAIFYTDRGRGYKNDAMDAPLTGFMARAGITAMRALPYNSQAKGVVERLNQVYTAAAKSLPTYIGEDMDKEAKLIAFKTTRRDLKAVGTSRLLTSWSDFIEHIDATLAAYNDRPHSSLPEIRDAQIGRKRHMTPNEVWAMKTADFEPIIPDAAELEEMFRPWVIRKTRRALVDWLGNSYFAAALEPMHGDDVIVGYDIRDASRVWVRTIELMDGKRMPGRLIAIATFEGHKTRYVPLSAEQAAMERRAKGRLGRLQNKIDVVEQELRGGALLDMTATFAAVPAVELDSEIIPAAAGRETISREKVMPLNASGRPFFADDVSMARWLAANPERATGSDVELLAELLTTHSTNELLRMSGVDLDGLRTLVRSRRTAGAANNKGTVA